MYLLAGIVCLLIVRNVCSTPIYVSIIDTQSAPSRLEPHRADLTVGAAYLAIEEINNRTDILPNHEIVPLLSIIPGTAPSTEVVKTFTELWRSSRDVISAFFGPPLSSEAIYPGLLAAYSDRTYLSWVAGCECRFADISEYSTFLRTTGNIALIGDAVVQFMDFFSWDRIAYIELHDNTHLAEILTLRTYVLPALEASGKQVFRNLELGQHDDIELSLSRAKDVARIIFISFCMNQYASRVVEAVQSQNLDNGDYVILLYATTPSIFSFVFEDSNTTMHLLDTLKSIIVFAPETLADTNTQDYNNFLQQVLNRSSYPPLNFSLPDGVLPGSFAANLYDLVYVYALGVHAAIEDGHTPSNGSMVAQYMSNVTFKGKSGFVQFGENRQRELAIAVFTLHECATGYEYKRLYGSQPLAQPNLTRILWPGNATSPPLDSPPCGWDNEYCTVPVAQSNEQLIGLSALVVLLPVVIALVVIVAVHLYWKRKREYWQRMQYQIDFEEIQFSQVDDDSEKQRLTPDVLTHKSSNHFLFPGIFGRLGHTGMKAKSRKLGTNYAVLRSTSAISAAKLKNQDVAVKCLHFLARLNEHIVQDLKMIMDLKHKNILELHGISQSSMTYVVMPYVGRKSIQDILRSKSVMPPEVEFYMLRDICQALIYLHNNSPLGVHGNLKSSNCLVDGRWNVKVSDLLPSDMVQQSAVMKMCTSVTVTGLRDLPRHLIERFAWTAPEILRNIGSTATPPCKQWSHSADVYSFAIIMQELLLKGAPFCANKEGDLSECVIMVAEGSGEIPYRPKLPNTNEPKGYIELTKLCWSEDPASRPSFTDILHNLEVIYPKIQDTNVMDTLMDRMAKYAEKLQSAVEERAAEITKEKQRCDELLSKMLPRNVIATLKQGQAVRAEQFEETTVCFTAISDFADIAAQSNPLEIVEFLNKLYVTFDNIIETRNVYKVETIGDTYMLVAGLPNRLHLTHAEVVARSALALLSASLDFTIPHMPEARLQLRIGLHSGPVVAGVTGSVMPRYCLFGDTVNTSSRMQSTGESHKIQISPTTYLLLWKLGKFEIQKRGKVFVKGKGDINTFWLIGEDPFNPGGDRTTLMLTASDAESLSDFVFFPLWLEEMGVKLE